MPMENCDLLEFNTVQYRSTQKRETIWSSMEIFIYHIRLEEYTWLAGNKSYHRLNESFWKIYMADVQLYSMWD